MVQICVEKTRIHKGYDFWSAVLYLSLCLQKYDRNSIRYIVSDLKILFAFVVSYGMIATTSKINLCSPHFLVFKFHCYRLILAGNINSLEFRTFAIVSNQKFSLLSRMEKSHIFLFVLVSNIPIIWKFAIVSNFMNMLNIHNSLEFHIFALVSNFLDSQ